MKATIEKYAIYTSITLVGLMIILITVISEHNRVVAVESIQLKEQGRNVIIQSSRFLTQFLQAIDQSLRAYALTKEDVHLAHFEGAINDITPVFEDTKKLLEDQRIALPESKPTLDSLLSELHTVKDSLIQYVVFCKYMVKLVDADSLDKFKLLLKEDKGMIPFNTWRDFQTNVTDFETEIGRKSDEAFAKASRFNTILRFSLLFLGLPTLLYAAYLIGKTFRLHTKIVQIETENVQIVTEQNAILEQKVEERTRDILAQNEEIISLNEELTAQQFHIEQQHNLLRDQNEELKNSKLIIENQNTEIQNRNELLEKEVVIRTQELTETNKELGDYTYQLEQFAFVTAHNLRSPIARILGLGELLNLPNVNAAEKEEIIKRMVTSSGELDAIIKDLNLILDIRKGQIQSYITLNLTESVAKSKRLLAEEIILTQTRVIENFSKKEVITVFPPYFDSIIMNLLSNAIKYRHPDRHPEILIHSEDAGQFTRLVIRDNGLGIDMAKYKDRIFDLYKRFHLHVDGKGLGLYLVKTQITAMGGRIEVDSELEKGTTFTLYFRNYTDDE